MIKAVIFDCFGVVVGKGTWDVFELAGGDLKKHGEFIEQLVDKRVINEVSTEQFAAALAEKAGVTIEEWKFLKRKYSQPNLGVLEYVSQLKNQGLKVAFLSNAARGTVEKLLSTEQLGIFDEVVVSGDVGIAKPNPKVFEYIADKLEVQLEECVFADDHDRYVQGAKAAGMQAVLFEDLDKFKTNLTRILS